jgi:hypothetical protein
MILAKHHTKHHNVSQRVANHREETEGPRKKERGESSQKGQKKSKSARARHWCLVGAHVPADDLDNLVPVLTDENNAVGIDVRASREGVNRVLASKGTTDKVQDVGHDAEVDHLWDPLDFLLGELALLGIT